MADTNPNLATRYLGLELPSPLVVGSSGVTDSVEGVQACERAGAGAVVLKSLFEEQIAAEVEQVIAASESPYWHPEAAEYISGYGTENAVGEYLRLIAEAKKAVSIPVIPSICCVSPLGWPKFAKQMAAAGADALELNVFVPPADPDRTGAQNEQVYCDVLAAVKKQVSIPVALKVGCVFSSLHETFRRLQLKGADGLVLFNRYYQPDLDIEKFQVVAGPALSSPEEMYLTLRSVAQLSGKLECDIAATTGVHDGTGLIKQLLVGATVVQVASALYRHGPEYITTMLDELRGWMQRQGFENLARFRGRMRQDSWPDGAAYDRVQFMKRTVGGVV